MVAGMRSYEQNFEREIDTALDMTAAQGRKVLVLGIYAHSDLPADAPPDALRVGAMSRAMTKGVDRDDVQFFITGLETEIARLKSLIE